MADGIACFMVALTGEMRRCLRRYASESECPVAPGYHDARGQIEKCRATRDDAGHYDGGGSVEDFAGDPRWPTDCACGYVFAESDARQVFVELLYGNGEGREMTIAEMPPGAMFDVAWTHEKGPDGRSLAVKLPGGPHDVWFIDGPSTSGGYWTRTGEPPRLTVSPSILTPKYHGFLRDGTLVPT